MNKTITSVITIVLFAGLVISLQHYRNNAAEYKSQRDEKQRQLTIARAEIGVLGSRIRNVAAIDERYTKELADAQQRNDALRHKLDANGRMFVNGKCPAMSSPTKTNSVGDATSIELAGDSRQNVLDIRSGVVSDRAKINYLQTYIQTQCRY